MSRLQLSLWGAVTAAVVAGSVVLVATSDHAGGAEDVLAIVVGASFIVSGIVARVRRPANLSGLLLLETGLLWMIGALAFSDNPWVFPIGHVYASLAFGPFTQLALSFPSGEIPLRRQRMLLGCVWFLVTVLQTVMLLVTPTMDGTCGDCPTNAYALTSSETASNAVEAVTTTGAILLIAWLLVEVVRRYRAASRPLRRTMTNVLTVSGVAVTFLAAANIASPLNDEVGNVFGAFFVVSFALVPVSFLAGVLQSRLARSSVAEMLARIGSGRSLREVIAETLCDPTLEIGYWLPARGHYVLADGSPLTVEEAARGTEVALDGRRIAVLLHDPAVADERELLRAVAAAAALSLETERLQTELREQLKLTVTVADTAPSLLVTITPDGRITNQNRAAVEAAGLDDEEEVRGRHFWDVFIDGWEREAMQERFHAAAPAFPPAEYENAFTNARGELRVIAWESAPLHDDDGNVIRIVAGGLDITERKAREDDLQRQRDFAETVFDTIPSLLVVLDPEGRVVPRGINRAVEQAFGWTPEEIEGKRFVDVVAHGAREEAEAAVARASAGLEEPERETCWLARDGDERIVAWTAKPVLDPEGRARVLVCGADVTERHRQDAELRDSRTRIVEAADEARRRLERNLHDGAQQRLVSLALSLRLAESKLLVDPEQAATTLAAAREELGHALDELRELARGIHPAILTDRGLGPALEALAGRCPLPVDLSLPESRLPAAVEAAVYYVVAEGLTNVARYAAASGARVRVCEEGGVVRVEVEDDGVGGASVDSGTGLRGLIDRVSALDGTLRVWSPLGGGTVLHAEIPLARASRRRGPIAAAPAQATQAAEAHAVEARTESARAEISEAGPSRSALRWDS